jgi:hypothetical protein
MARTRIRSFLPLVALGLLAFASAPVLSEDEHVIVQCMNEKDDCRQRIIRLPDGMPGQVLKFEYCREGDCDRAHRERWITHFLVPPPGEVCRNTDIGEALRWLEQNRKGWLLAGWGCVSKQRLPV